ncbi:cyclic lactone autoinducer peptide [uncultured Eubacterium sp.]|nr:cyclic lactone autoinducer peptide [uncultured Eubacterium sp.]
MNVLKRKSIEMLAKEAKLMTKFSVNSTCRNIMYQPQMPKGADKLKKYD